MQTKKIQLKGTRYSLKIESRDVDILMQPSKNDFFKYSIINGLFINGMVHVMLSLSEKNSELNISARKTQGKFELLKNLEYLSEDSEGSENDSLVIELPKNCFKNITLKSKNSDIYISKFPVDFETLDCQSKKGNIKVNLDLENDIILNLETKNGNILVSIPGMSKDSDLIANGKCYGTIKQSKSSKKYKVYGSVKALKGKTIFK